MAQPKKATFVDDATDLDNSSVDEFPEEFTSNSSATLALDESSLDDFDLGQFKERDSHEYQKDNPPGGTWVKEDEWSYKIFVNEQDSRKGDINPQGRTLLIFTGRPKVRVVNNIDYDPILSFRISPDLRYKDPEDADGREDQKDLASRLWTMAKEKMYLEMKGAMPQKLRDITDMLRYDEYEVRSMKGDNGPVVLEVRTKQQQRRGRRG